jgi:hypothetical protein
MTPHEFIAKWKTVTLSECSACEQHFLALCELLGQPTPAEAVPAPRTASPLAPIPSVGLRFGLCRLSLWLAGLASGRELGQVGTPGRGPGSMA